jgi:3-phosphoshikimate 1-carboxyvinyltransferase
VIRIIYPGRALIGEASLPGDKSLSHRAALFAALAEGESCIDNFQDSGVTKAMLSALAELGVEWSLAGLRLRVTGPGWNGWRAPGTELNCGNSATTLRLLAGALSGSGLPGVLDGSPGLRRRPMGRILEPLRLMGAPVEAVQEEFAPLRLSSRSPQRPLQGIEYSLPVASAQVKSCLMLAGLAAESPLTLHEPGPSRDHTERMLRHMGCRVDSRSDPHRRVSTVVLHPPQQPLLPLRMSLPADISAASFLIAAALISPGSQITLRNVGLNPTRTGILEVFQAMGADLSIGVKGEQSGEPFGDITASSSQLSGVRVEGDLVVRMIDEFPILAIAACFAHGATEVRNAGELRYKESDRITTVCRRLKLLGAKITETEDGFVIHGPCPLDGGTIDPHGDHRMAMAFSVAGLAARAPVRILQADIAGESFPGFFDTLTTLGAEVRTEGEHAS